MGEVAVDFGTSNTVLARYNEMTGRAETIQIPEVSVEQRYRLTPAGEEHSVWVVPSLIHYGESATLIGNQVVSPGLAEHPDTMRWMKRAIAQANTRRKKTAQGHKSPAEAGEEFLRLVLNYASDQVSFENDTFTFTVPVEAFETFQDWIWRLAESIGIRKLRLLDEPTASVFGYQGAARTTDRFVVVDFGGGTLDVSAVRLDLAGPNEHKAVQLGQAGCDLGGMDIDQWIAEDFCSQRGITAADRRELENFILRQAEAVKISLSDPTQVDAEMAVVSTTERVARTHQITYRRTCPKCAAALAGGPAPPGRSAAAAANTVCLGCLLVAKEFTSRLRDTLERALENAAVKSGMRRGDITAVMVTGGTSLVPAVRAQLQQVFGDRVVFDHPFDCVVRGACRGLVAPILQHDYAIESYDRETRQYGFKELFRIGTEYPTSPEKPQRFWCNGSTDGQTRVGLVIYEVSRMAKRHLEESMVDEQGRIRRSSKVATNYEHIALNHDNPTFINADPPINRERDKQRFLCSFVIDGNRRLLVTVVDQHSGKPVLKNHPVVRL